MAELSGSVAIFPAADVDRGVAAREWRSGWPAVVAGLFGFMMGGFGTSMMGAFIAPIETEFHWNRVDFTSGLSVLAVVSIVMAVPVGALIDKFGPRPVALVGAVMAGAGYALFATATGKVGNWLVIWLVFATCHQFVGPAVWSRAVASVFTTSRGMAMSTIMMGGAVIAAGGPIATNLLIEHYGWRMAFVILGLGATLALGLVSFLGLPTSRRIAGPSGAVQQTAPLTGFFLAEGLRSASFLKLAVVNFVVYVVFMGLGVHIIPLLSAAGLSRNAAVMVGGSVGVSMLLGKLIGGFALDRFSGRLVAAAGIGLLAVSVPVLALPGHAVSWALVRVGFYGFSYGAVAPIFPYLASRYFGLRSFGRLFAALMCLSGVAAGVGPVLFGQIYDMTHSYWLCLTGMVPALLLALGLVLSLGPFPRFAEPDEGGSESVREERQRKGIARSLMRAAR